MNPYVQVFAHRYRMEHSIILIRPLKLLNQLQNSVYNYKKKKWWYLRNFKNPSLSVTTCTTWQSITADCGKGPTWPNFDLPCNGPLSKMLLKEARKTQNIHPRATTKEKTYYFHKFLCLSEELTRSGRCDPIETSRPAAALCQSALSS